MPSIFQPQTMPVDPWCYYRAFKITAQGNDTVIFLIGLFSTTTTTPTPPRLLSFLVDISRMPPCLWNSIKHPVTFRKEKKEGKKKIISVADGTGTMKSFTLWPHLASSSGGSGRSRGQRGGASETSTAALNKKKRFFFLPLLKRRRRQSKGVGGGCAAALC